MIKWSDREIELVNEVEIFRLKPEIMKKAENRLTELKDALVREVSETKHLFPPHTDIVKGQIARGENYKGFPFVSLDMPQKFSREEMFTYRILFWWGHCLAFSFILKGKALHVWLSNILGRKGKAKDIHFSLTPTPWEWDPNDQNYKLLLTMQDSELESVVAKNQYLKLVRFRSVSMPNFKSLNWATEGIEAFRIMTGLFMD